MAGLSGKACFEGFFHYAKGESLFKVWSLSLLGSGDMAKKSLIDRFASAFKEPETTTTADIDRAVESEIAAIRGAQENELAAETLLGGDWGNPDDMVFIMDLKPMFEMVGGRETRSADGVIAAAERVFEEFRRDQRDRGVFENDNFLMRFEGVSGKEGFRHAVRVVNEVGMRVLRDRFIAMPLPKLLVAAKTKDVTKPDGSIDAFKIEGVVEAGGVLFPMTHPSPDDPEWVRIKFRETQTSPDLIAIERPAPPKAAAPTPGVHPDLDWKQARANLLGKVKKL